MVTTWEVTPPPVNFTQIRLLVDMLQLKVPSSCTATWPLGTNFPPVLLLTMAVNVVPEVMPVVLPVT